jgi:hypothetical protein
MATQDTLNPTSRDRSVRRLRRLTVGAAIAGSAATAGFGAVAAVTYPGSTSSTTASFGSTAATTTSTTGGTTTTDAATTAVATAAPTMTTTTTSASTTTRTGRVTTGGS